MQGAIAKKIVQTSEGPVIIEEMYASTSVVLFAIESKNSLYTVGAKNRFLGITSRRSIFAGKKRDTSLSDSSFNAMIAWAATIMRAISRRTELAGVK